MSNTDANGNRVRRRIPPRVLILASPHLKGIDIFDGAPFEAFATATEILEVLRFAAPSTVVLVHGLDDTYAVSDEVQAVLAAAGIYPVVAWTRFSPLAMPGIRALLELGAADVVDLGLERAAAAVLPRITAAIGRPLKARIEPALPPYLSQNALTLIRAALDVVLCGGGAPEFAERFECLVRTVSGWCVREGLPAPRRLQAWLRLLVALALLENRGRTVLAAARQAGYANEHSLRRTLGTFLGTAAARAPREVSFRSGLQAFVAELGAERDRRRGANIS